MFDYIKDIVDEKKTKGQFYLTGSQSLKLMKNVSESLAMSEICGKDVNPPHPSRAK